MTTNNELLFQLIARSNTVKYKFKATDFDVAEPQLDINTGRNSKIQITAKPNSGFKGSLWLHYTRESIGNVSLPTQNLSEGPITIQSILAALNKKLLVPITPDDVEFLTVPALSVGDICTLTLTPRSGSFAWIGSTEVSFLYGLPPNIDDISTIFNVDLVTAVKLP